MAEKHPSKAPRKPADEKRIGVEAFARIAGCDKKAVMQAIESGYIEDAAEFVGGRWLLDRDKARANWARNHRDTATASPKLREFLHGSQPPQPFPDPTAATDAQIRSMTRQEAERTKAAYAALAAKRDYEESMQLLVRVQEVKEALHAFAQVARVELEGLPSRLVDAIDSATTRHAKMRAAEAEVRKSLTFLADLDGATVPLKTGR